MSLAVQSIADDDDPLTHRDAVSSSERANWEAVIQRELDCFRKNKVSTLVNRPIGHKFITIGVQGEEGSRG